MTLAQRKPFDLGRLAKLWPVFVVVLLFSILPGCKSALRQPGESDAREFMDLYYVRADLQAAMEMSVDLAAEKLKQEMTLGGGQSSAESRGQRRVKYSKQTRATAADTSTATPSPDRVEFFYALDVTVERSSMKRLVRVTLEKRGGVWKVVNFVESAA